MSQCQGVFRPEKTYRRKVSSLRSTTETDFDSVMVTTWLKPVRIRVPHRQQVRQMLILSCDHAGDSS
jgi:hypothetical protein